MRAAAAADGESMAMLRRALVCVATAAAGLLAGFGPASAYGADIHVAPFGDDAAGGSAAAPLRSLQRAVNVAGPGDRVLVAPGTYSGFRMTRSGTPDAPITITAADGGRPRIGTSGTSDSVVLLDSVHDVAISGLEVAGNPTGWGAGIRVRGASTRITLTDLDIHDNRSFGVLLEDVSDVALTASRLSRNETGLQVSRAGAGVRIAGNDVYDNDRMIVDDAQADNDRGANGMAFYKTAGPTIVEGNRIWGNRATSRDYGFDGGAFEVYAASGLTIRDNVAWNNENVLETGTDGSLPCARNAFTGNVAYGGARNGPAMGMILRCASDMLVANNTFDDLDRFAFDVTADASSFGGSVEGLRIARNVSVSGADKLLSVDSLLPSSVAIDENLLFNRSGAWLASYPGRGNTRLLSALTSWSGLQAAGVQADPLFVDPALADFRLRPGSPVPAGWGAREALALAQQGAAPRAARKQKKAARCTRVNSKGRRVAVKSKACRAAAKARARRAAAKARAQRAAARRRAAAQRRAGLLRQ